MSRNRGKVALALLSPATLHSGVAPASTTSGSLNTANADFTFPVWGKLFCHGNTGRMFSYRDLASMSGHRDGSVKNSVCLC